MSLILIDRVNTIIENLRDLGDKESRKVLMGMIDEIHSEILTGKMTVMTDMTESTTNTETTTRTTKAGSTDNANGDDNTVSPPVVTDETPRVAVLPYAATTGEKGGDKVVGIIPDVTILPPAATPVEVSPPPTGEEVSSPPPTPAEDDEMVEVPPPTTEEGDKTIEGSSPPPTPTDDDEMVEVPPPTTEEGDKTIEGSSPPLTPTEDDEMVEVPPPTTEEEVEGDKTIEGSSQPPTSTEDNEMVEVPPPTTEEEAEGDKTIEGSSPPPTPTEDDEMVEVPPPTTEEEVEGDKTIEGSSPPPTSTEDNEMVEVPPPTTEEEVEGDKTIEGSSPPPTPTEDDEMVEVPLPPLPATKEEVEVVVDVPPPPTEQAGGDEAVAAISLTPTEWVPMTICRNTEAVVCGDGEGATTTTPTHAVPETPSPPHRPDEDDMAVCATPDTPSPRHLTRHTGDNEERAEEESVDKIMREVVVYTNDDELVTTGILQEEEEDDDDLLSVSGIDPYSTDVSRATSVYTATTPRGGGRGCNWQPRSKKRRPHSHRSPSPMSSSSDEDGSPGRRTAKRQCRDSSSSPPPSDDSPMHDPVAEIVEDISHRVAPLLNAALETHQLTQKLVRYFKTNGAKHVHDTYAKSQAVVTTSYQYDPMVIFNEIRTMTIKMKRPCEQCRRDQCVQSYKKLYDELESLTIKLCHSNNMHVGIPFRFCLCGDECNAFHVYRLIGFVDKLCYILCTYNQQLAYQESLIFLRETTRGILDKCNDAAMRVEMVDTNKLLVNMYLVDTQFKYVTNNVYRLATRTKSRVPSIDQQFYHTMVSNNEGILETMEVAKRKVKISMCNKCNQSQFMDRGVIYGQQCPMCAPPPYTNYPPFSVMHQQW